MAWLPLVRQALQRPGLAVLLLALPWAAQALPSYREVRARFRPSHTLILAADRQVASLRTNAQVRRGQWVALQHVSPALRLALLGAKDKRFYEHSGVDWVAVSAAAWGNLWHQRHAWGLHHHHAAGRAAG